MKSYRNVNVFDAALDRMRWVFDEFENVLVNFSGGKDSTVIFHLAMMVAEEKKRLPLKVFFIDQEAEWLCVIDYIRTVMNDQRVDPIWLQMPIRIFNATSTIQPWLMCWEEGVKWIREKEPNSVHENIFWTDRFGELFGAYCKVMFPGEPAAHIGGVRCEESPARALGLTTYASYKYVTWGSVDDSKAGQYAFYPIYDWSYTDVWKAIHSNGWPYCKLYDYMYQYGIPVKEMRVSNVHHETAVRSLFFLQEIEPENWDRITERLAGTNTANQMQQGFFGVHDLPFMFSSWLEYRDYLLDHLITDQMIHDTLKRQFANNDALYEDSLEAMHDLVKTEISMIMTNDYHGTKLSVFHASHGRFSKNSKHPAALAARAARVMSEAV